MRLYCICVWNWGLGFLTVWSLDEVIVLKRAKCTETPPGIELLAGVVSALEGYSSPLIHTFILFSNRSFSHYYGAPVLCHIVMLGCRCCVGNCLTTGFLNEMVLIWGICRFLFYKYSHCGWLQALGPVTLNRELGRDTRKLTYSGRRRFGQNCLWGSLPTTHLTEVPLTTVLFAFWCVLVPDGNPFTLEMTQWLKNKSTPSFFPKHASLSTQHLQQNTWEIASLDQMHVRSQAYFTSLSKKDQGSGQD